MASFIGTKEEFKRYVGPMLRNLVQQLTKKHKMGIGQCEHCGTSGTLEAAHKHGKDRGALIDKILNNHTNNNVVTIDLAKFEQYFRNEHEIIDDTILILCRTCHSKYDSQSPVKEMLKPKNNSRLYSNEEIQRRISSAAKSLTSNELEKLCGLQQSKELFNINFPLFVQVSKNITEEYKRNAVKDWKGANRWTWKYEFEKAGFLYAISTQWYGKNDIHVKQWLSKNE